MPEQYNGRVVEDSQLSMYGYEDYAAPPYDRDEGVNDFEDADAPIEDETTREPVAFLEFFNGLSQEKVELPIFAGKELRVGREDPDKCHWIIPDPRVSKQHFRIYSVLYDKVKKEVPPLVYCEDLESTNGTYLNNQCIGTTGGPRKGFLLSHGDTIEIKPHWAFHFHEICQSTEYTNSKCPNKIRDIQYFEDQYTITNRLLGSGQFGQVFLAKELFSAQQLACKVVDLSRCGEVMQDSGETIQDRAFRAREEKRRVLNEIKVLSELSHPHIIDLKKAFCSNNFVYMFTELASAGDLYSYLDSRGGTVTDLEARVLCTQVVQALDYMHTRQIAHRDLKPENVLVMQTYEFSCRVVLTDFGFASHVDRKTGRLLSRVGTDGYCAPEVENVNPKEGGYTLAADMWSLGELTFTILIGSQHSQQIAKEFARGRDHGTDITPRAKKFLHGLLVPDPMKRMTSSQAALHSWLSKPFTEGAAIEEACKRINRFWKCREHDNRVIEDLPDRVLSLQKEQVSSGSGTKPRRKIPDVSPYPYFGLDRYFQHPRPHSTRGPLLDDLKEKEALFVTEKPSLPARRHQNSRVVSVSARDLFGMNEKQATAGPSSTFENYGYSKENERYSTYAGSRAGTKPTQPSSDFQNMYPAKRVRMESKDHDDRRARDTVSKQIPRYRNAKEFGELVRGILMKPKATRAS